MMLCPECSKELGPGAGQVEPKYRFPPGDPLAPLYCSSCRDQRNRAAWQRDEVERAYKRGRRETGLAVGFLALIMGICFWIDFGLVLLGMILLLSWFYESYWKRQI